MASSDNYYTHDSRMALKMKTINMTFDDRDFNNLKKAKEKTGKSWESFFIEAVENANKHSE